MKKEELAALTQKSWVYGFVEMPVNQLTAEIVRRKGGQWYLLSSGTLLLGQDYGEYFVPGCRKVDWSAQLPENYLLDTDSYPDYANNSSAAMQLGLELREKFGDPYRLLLETDENNRKRWLAMFRRSYAYAWGDTPAEAMCRAYLIAYELNID